MRRHTWSGPQKPTHHNRDGERLVSILPVRESPSSEHWSDECLGSRCRLKKIYCKNTTWAIDSQDSYSLGTRGHTIKATWTSADEGKCRKQFRTLVGASGVGSDGWRTWSRNNALISYLYTTWEETVTKRTECGRIPQRTYVVLHKLSDICL